MVNNSRGAPLLDCRRIGKRFGGTVALEGVDFAMCAGEVHGLVGANGAGKSTLMKILAGALPDHEGEIRLAGKLVRLASPTEAHRLGIAMVYQELSGVGQLSVAENLFLGRQPVTWTGRVDWRRMRRESKGWLAELGVKLDERRRLDRCPLAARQLVEIARGLHSGARVLILDEPTSALSAAETGRLFALIQGLRRRGVAIIFISHFIEDVLAICDRVTILRDGRRIETRDAGELDKHAVIGTMLGHPLGRKATETEDAQVGYERGVTLPERSREPVVLRTKGLARRSDFAAIDLAVSAGECLGLYGLAGAGHLELARAIAGALTPSAGRVLLDEKPLLPGDVHDAVRRGLVLVSADRAKALVSAAPIYQNVTLAHLKRTVGEWLTVSREVRVTRPVLQRVGCRPATPRLAAGKLSGGNQQKLVLAKWLLGPVRGLVLEEPTRGMDVHAKEEIMQQVAEQKRTGCAVLIASSEPELLLAHCDRICVVRRGRVTAEFAGCPVDKPTLMAVA